MPIVPAPGAVTYHATTSPFGMLCPIKYNVRHVPSPKIAEDTAPNRFTFLQKSPQMNGPKKNDPIAPHEIPNI